jgi:hypothetical protein
MDYGSIQVVKKQFKNLFIFRNAGNCGRTGKTFPFIRVDFFDTREQLYLNEIKFSPGAGVEKIVPEELDLMLGEKIEMMRS